MSNRVVPVLVLAAAAFALPAHATGGGGAGPSLVGQLLFLIRWTVSFTRIAMCQITVSVEKPGGGVLARKSHAEALSVGTAALLTSERRARLSGPDSRS